MNFNCYSLILHICCVILAAAIVFLSLKLRRLLGKSGSADEKTEPGPIEAASDKALLEEIEQGLKNGEFKMYLQFIVDNKTKQIVSAEGLSRWEKPNGELVFPGYYLPAMEKAGLITRLDYYMFEKACRKLEEWKGSEFGNITISCNVTRATISESDFVSRLKEISDRYTFDNTKLIIEITEDTLEKNLDDAIQNIISVKELGFSIALDDIGSGYAALRNLCEYPIDIVKMDREILLLTKTKKAQKLFLGIIALAHNLGLSVVCEGVETDEQNRFVSESDCDHIQGLYYSKGIAEARTEDFVRDYTTKLASDAKTKEND